MKKKVWIFLSIIIFAAIISTTLVLTRPDESDFAIWMEQNYDVNCLDFNCTAFQIGTVENGKENIVTMQSVYGGYSPGIFVMKNEMIYRNLEDSSYVLDLKVKGFLGRFSVVDETKHLSTE